MAEKWQKVFKTLAQVLQTWFKWFSPFLMGLNYHVLLKMFYCLLHPIRWFCWLSCSSIYVHFMRANGILLLRKMFRLVSDIWTSFIVFSGLYKYKSRPSTQLTIWLKIADMYMRIYKLQIHTHTIFIPLSISASYCYSNERIIRFMLIEFHIFFGCYCVLLSSFFFFFSAEQRLNKKKSASNGQWMLSWCFHIKLEKWLPKKIQTSKIPTWASFWVPHGSKCNLFYSQSFLSVFFPMFNTICQVICTKYKWNKEEKKHKLSLKCLHCVTLASDIKLLKQVK